MSRRSHAGSRLDSTGQCFSERPYGDDDGETVEVVASDGDDPGEETVENVPIPGERDETPEDPNPDDREQPAGDGQTIWTNWGWLV